MESAIPPHLKVARGEPIRLRLYHEVAVAEPGEQWFEYARCEPAVTP